MNSPAKFGKRSVEVHAGPLATAFDHNVQGKKRPLLSLKSWNIIWWWGRSCLKVTLAFNPTLSWKPFLKSLITLSLSAQTLLQD